MTGTLFLSYIYYYYYNYYCLTNQNSIHEEIKRGLKTGNSYYSVHTLLSSRLLSKILLIIMFHAMMGRFQLELSILITYFSAVIPLNSSVFFPVGLSSLTRHFQQVLQKMTLDRTRIIILGFIRSTPTLALYDIGHCLPLIYVG